MVLNEDTVDIKNPYAISLLTFVMNKFSELFIHPLFFSVIHLINGTLSNFLY